MERTCRWLIYSTESHTWDIPRSLALVGETLRNTLETLDLGKAVNPFSKKLQRAMTQSC